MTEGYAQDGELTKIRRAARGAEFVRADLQIHTPIDQGFRLPNTWNTETEDEKKRIAAGYISAAQKAGVGILGITEHNDLTYAPWIRDAARDSGVTVYPGVEFTLPPKLHLIALFEPEADIERLWDLIVKLGLGKKKSERFHADGTPKQIKGTIEEFLRLVEEYGGLVIAPHACSDAGILRFSEGQSRAEAWKQEAILAADPGNGRRIPELSTFEKGAFENTLDIYGRTRKMPAIWTSDARTFDDIGRCHTWLKVSSPTLEGLRQAFLDPESRIRHAVEFSGAKYPRILGISWQGPGFLAEQVVGFNDNLNCLIGGKGVGKSSVIETLRFAFGLEPPADTREATQSHLRSVLPSGGMVTVVIESHEPRKTYVIERTQGGYDPVVKDGDGKVVPGVKPTDVQRLSVFGQKEIYGIALKPGDQLKALDDFIATRIVELGAEEAGVKADLVKNATALLVLQAETEGILEDASELPKLQHLKKRYEELGIVAKLERRTTFQANLKRLRDVRTKLTGFLASIENVETGLTSDYDAVPEADPLRAALEQARGLLDETGKEWVTSVAALRTSVAGRVAVLDGLLTDAERESRNVESEFRAIAAEIQKEYPNANIEEYLKLEKQIEAIAPLKKRAEQKAAKIAKLQGERKAFLDKLLAVRRTRYEERHRKAQELNGRLEKALRVRVNFQGRVDAVRTGLESLKAGLKKVALDGLMTHPDFSLPGLLTAVDQGPTEVTKRFGLTDAAAKTLTDALSGKTRLEWDGFDVPDAIKIDFNVSPLGAEPQYRPLETLSVGQKSTAILLLLLLKDDNPFVIDQPEDDLDNRFIYEDIVQRLRQAKEQRQFIVATHNANIPVLGDAEQIVVLSASNNQGRVERTGSIDAREIQTAVKSILEGGEQAFEMRQKKYGF